MGGAGGGRLRDPRAGESASGRAGWREGGGGGGCFFLTVTGSLALGCGSLDPPCCTHARSDVSAYFRRWPRPSDGLPLTVIEQLPMDLRDRFTEMREMDLQVQSKSGRLPSFAVRVRCQTYLHLTPAPEPMTVLRLTG